MTSDALEIARVLISEIWRFLTSWYIPGTNITPAAFICFWLLFPIILSTVFSILSISSDYKKGGNE